MQPEALPPPPMIGRPTVLPPPFWALEQFLVCYKAITLKETRLLCHCSGMAQC